MPVLLAIETSQHRGSVAVRLSDGRIDSESLSQKKRHDDDLLPAIDRLFSRHGLKPRDLRGEGGGVVAVSIGPGGFTGLRIAVATAKMFAETLGTKIIAVPSALGAAGALGDLQSAVSGQPTSQPPASSAKSADRFLPASNATVHVALSAKNNTFWLTRLQRTEGAWRISEVYPPGIVDAQSMNLQGIDAMLADEHLPADARTRCERENIPIITPVFEAANVVAVALRMQSRGEFTDPLALLPLYPRQPEAVTIWEQKKRTP